ncbi:MAG: ABC transporter ATP-binding protein/permease [Clostridiales Family XIII bacterium]|jgi:ATP-binding cassette subfamily B protein|nr:ABC transporter ATP-binding protein/permease [Clostridiales Family XIII bacterium]
MVRIKKLLRLSDEGYEGLKRGVFAAVLSNICMFLPFGIAIMVINILLQPLTGGGTLDTRGLWLCLGAGVAAAILYFIVYTNEYRKTYTVAYNESEKIRVEVAEKLRRLPLSFFNRKDLSELTTNIMGDCTSIEQSMSHVLPNLFGGSISVTIVCVLLAFYTWRMAIALFAALPVAFGLIFVTKKLMSIGDRHVQAKLNVAEQMQEYLEGIKVVKAFGLAGEKSAALKNALSVMLREAIKFELIAGTFITLAMMVLQVGIGLVTLVGVTLLTGGSLSPLALLMFLIVSVKIYSPIIVILTMLPEFFYMLVSTRRMQALREETPMAGDEDAVLSDYNVEMKNVSFAYNDMDVISDISLTIPQNGVTAFVGPSGSGKTTVSRLIARFWDVREGEITIGGRDIREIDPERLMSYMSFVFQDVVLFGDTVMNNIRIGKHGATDEEIYAAAKMARCDEFVRNMPDGYETVIGENGSTLSGGERQRISIARALLKDAPIVLLDEATASLDPENETQIQEAISTLIEGRTVIVIAHRLRTVIGADKVVVLDGGKLIEEGTGAELLAQNGLFARLYKVQQESLGWTAGKGA